VVRERDDIDLHVGARLRFRRLERGMSQEALATAVGLRFQQIQKYEKGQNRIGASRLYRLAAALDVPLPYFFEGLPQPGSETAIGSVRATLAFLGTADGQELAQAYMAIEDAPTRRKLLEFVRSLAESARPGR
jgi:transcriptional regulator with XRE-family HTH domain